MSPQRRRATQLAGLIASLIGVMIMSAARFNPRIPPVFVPIGLGVIAVGWALFVASRLGHRMRQKPRNTIPETRRP